MPYEDGARIMQSSAAVTWKHHVVESSQLIFVTTKTRTMTDKWEHKQQLTFTQLRDALLKEPILGYLGYDKPHHIFAVASSMPHEGELMQRHSVGRSENYFAVTYCSKMLSDSEKRWPAIQIELGAIIICSQSI
ncbi:hypothetical protein Aduo_005093 [Ancylostoma duodenale]